MKPIPVMREVTFNGRTMQRRDGAVIIDDDRIITRHPAGLDGLPSIRINRIKREPAP